MLPQQYLKTNTTNIDPLMVEQLVRAIASGMEHACIPHVTSTAEIVSALFTTITRVLRGIRESEEPEDVSHNREEISRVLDDLMAEFGMIQH